MLLETIDNMHANACGVKINNSKVDKFIEYSMINYLILTSEKQVI